jgi:peptidoglycan/LPS O-acetylase OafA/YrhL
VISCKSVIPAVTHVDGTAPEMLMDVQNRHKKIGVINGLRGLAIIAVIYQHLLARFTPHGWHAFEIGSFNLSLYSFLSNGWLGVNLFFFLSGFVLYLPYSAGQRTMGSMVDVWSFYKHRWVRLMPLYYLNLLIALVFVPPPPWYQSYFHSRIAYGYSHLHFF